MTDRKSIGSEALMSKLMDGEISELELHRLLKETERSDELREQWSAWHFASDLRRGVDVDPIGLSLADRIAHEIDAGTSNTASPTAANESRWSMVKQFAVAACAAVFVIAVVPFTQQSQSVQPEQAVAFQSVDQPIYNLNSQWALPQMAPQTVSAEMSPFGPSVEANGAAQAELSAEARLEQQRIQRLMSEYMWLHAGKAGMNTSSSARAYLQVAPKQ
jgi:sigma-E factor negative regulatory protein RseA